jgi:hypothetical protein
VVDRQGAYPNSSRERRDMTIGSITGYPRQIRGAVITLLLAWLTSAAVAAPIAKHNPQPAPPTLTTVLAGIAARDKAVAALPSLEYSLVIIRRENADPRLVAQRSPDLGPVVKSSRTTMSVTSDRDRIFVRESNPHALAMFWTKKGGPPKWIFQAQVTEAGFDGQKSFEAFPTSKQGTFAAGTQMIEGGWGGTALSRPQLGARQPKCAILLGDELRRQPIARVSLENIMGIRCVRLESALQSSQYGTYHTSWWLAPGYGYLCMRRSYEFQFSPKQKWAKRRVSQRDAASVRALPGHVWVAMKTTDKSTVTLTNGDQLWQEVHDSTIQSLKLNAHIDKSRFGAPSYAKEKLR